MKRIELISFYKDRIKLSNKDVISFLKQISRLKNSTSDILVYLDPPYVKQGKDLYLNYFEKEDHIKLSKYLQKDFKNLWITSYDDNELIHSIYKEVTKNIFEFNYFANKTKIGRELIIASKNCTMIEKYNHYSKVKLISDFDIVSTGHKMII